MSKKALKTSVVTDFLRLLRRTYTPFSLLLILGKMLQKRALRTLSIAAIAMWGVILQSVRLVEQNYLGSDIVDRLLPHIEAALITISLLFPIGLIITGTFNLVAHRYERKARMNNLILTGDLKKKYLCRVYFELLWEHIYRKEAEINPKFAHCADRDAFITLCYNAVNTAQPQCIQELETGVPLSLVEAWSRIGVFTTDDQLGDFIAYHQILREARLLMHHPILQNLKHALKGDKNPSFWHSLTIRKVKLSIGKNLIRMNRDHQTSITGQYFRAEHFVWPSKSIDHAVQKAFPNSDSLGLLQTTRRTIFRKTYTDDWPTARRHIMRMFKQDYVAALKMRLLFDPEYVINGDAQRDLEALEELGHINLFKDKKIIKAQRQAQTHWLSLKQWQDSLSQAQRDALSAETLRALWIALQINHDGLRKKIHKVSYEEVLDLLGPVTPFSRCLRKIREIHLLASFQIDMYLFLVSALGEFLEEPQLDEALTPLAAQMYREHQCPPWGELLS